ncbi:hypothetical protein ACFQH8_22005 [Halomicroarcula sp. GCM10025710]
MSDKPASMYQDIDKPSYTRREYITGIPGSKIAQHKMGRKQKDADDYPVQISLIVEESCQAPSRLAGGLAPVGQPPPHQDARRGATTR